MKVTYIQLTILFYIICEQVELLYDSNLHNYHYFDTSNYSVQLTYSVYCVSLGLIDFKTASSSGP